MVFVNETDVYSINLSNDFTAVSLYYRDCVFLSVGINLIITVNSPLVTMLTIPFDIAILSKSLFFSTVIPS
jgi:hypothetical protein